MKIRHTIDSDRDAIANIHLNAFGQEEGPEIVVLINNLFEDETAKPLLSLVAEVDNSLVGHILFTRVVLHPDQHDLSLQILAPLAVLSDFQGQGIGRALIKEGLAQLTASGVDLVFVLGDPKYYTRFGFQPAGSLGFEATYPIPAEHADAWMVQQLRDGVIGTVKGKVQCCEALSQPQYWIE